MTKYLFLFVVVMAAIPALAQEKPCLRPRLSIFKSAQTAVEGDKVVFNVDVDIPNFDKTGLHYEWNVFPVGKFSEGRDAMVATLDTTGVGSTELIVSVAVWPVEECRQKDSIGIKIRRRGPYTKADDFWWWFLLNSMSIRAYEEPGYNDWMKEVGRRLRLVDSNLTFRMDRDRPDPVNDAFIIGFRKKPGDEKALKEFVERAPSLAGWEILIEKDR